MDYNSPIEIQKFINPHYYSKTLRFNMGFYTYCDSNISRIWISTKEPEGAILWITFRGFCGLQFSYPIEIQKFINPHYYSKTLRFNMGFYTYCDSNISRIWISTKEPEGAILWITFRGICQCGSNVTLLQKIIRYHILLIINMQIFVISTQFFIKTIFKYREI